MTWSDRDAERRRRDQEMLDRRIANLQRRYSITLGETGGRGCAERPNPDDAEAVEAFLA
jgi:hypothetical protein